MPAAFPGIQSASFFSDALVEPGQPFSIPDVYFTANPFNSLANAAVPAVVLFSSMLGIALIGVDQRERCSCRSASSTRRWSGSRSGSSTSRPPGCSPSSP